MPICTQCEDQAKKSKRGKPHPALVELDAPRIFSGSGPRGFEEQDYQCLTCQTRFTRSSDKNDLAWTLWQA